MKAPQRRVRLKLVAESAVHRFDIFALLAEQKEIYRAGKPQAGGIRGGKIFADRRHVQIVGEKDTAKAHALPKQQAADFI